jgi:hypothetical protein
VEDIETSNHSGHGGDDECGELLAHGHGSEPRMTAEHHLRRPLLPQFVRHERDHQRADLAYGLPMIMRTMRSDDILHRAWISESSTTDEA